MTSGSQRSTHETRSSVSQYRFNAVRNDGARETGSLHAACLDEARRMLSERGLFPIDVKAEGSSTIRLTSQSARASLSASDAAIGLRLLANLLGSGLPVSRSLAAFADVAPASWRGGIPDLRSGIKEGQSLAAALDRSTLRLPGVVVGIIRSGEAAGKLGPAVDSAAHVLEDAAATRSALKSALAYPLILAAASIASTTLLVGVVLPKFADLLRDMGQDLPRSTQLLLDVSNAARLLGPLVLVCAAGLTIVIKRDSRTPEGLRMWHALLLRIPVIGAIRFSSSTARASSALSALLASGMPLAAGLVHAAHAADDAEVARRLAAARARVVAGMRLSDAAALEHALTGTAIQMVRAAEESGRMVDLLAHAAQLENGWVTTRVRTTVRLIEPIMILAFGGLVALVAAALLQAVYSIRPGS